MMAAVGKCAERGGFGMGWPRGAGARREGGGLLGEVRSAEFFECSLEKGSPIDAGGR